MSGDAHVRICESLGVQSPRATRLFITINGHRQNLWRAVDQDVYRTRFPGHTFALCRLA